MHHQNTSATNPSRKSWQNTTMQHTKTNQSRLTLLPNFTKIYLLYCVELGFYKIGISKHDDQTRLKQIEGKINRIRERNAEEVVQILEKLYLPVYGAKKLEKLLHYLCSYGNVRFTGSGVEWFDFWYRQKDTSSKLVFLYDVLWFLLPVRLLVMSVMVLWSIISILSVFAVILFFCLSLTIFAFFLLSLIL